MDRDIMVIIAISLVGTIVGGAFIASSISLSTPDSNQYQHKYSQDLNYTENQYVESNTDKQFSVVVEVNESLTEEEFNSTVQDVLDTGVELEDRSYENRTLQVETTPKELRKIASLNEVRRLDVP